MVSDPGDYPWSSYRANALGLANPMLSPHPLYLALGTNNVSRLEVYRDLLRTALDDAPLADLRMALNQDQPVGNSRFYAQIEAMTGQRRELRKRGRPNKNNEKEPLQNTGQQELPL
jgi:putative transposase